MDRDEWQARCETELGKPYIWGAEGPDAYDCSGFVQWALQPLGLDPPGDQTAASLYQHFSNARSEKVTAAEARPGDLVFFGSNGSVTHIALAWGDEAMLEAGGGGRKTTTIAIARQLGAEVRVRPIARRRDLFGILRPNALPWPVNQARMLESAEGFGEFTNSPPLTEWLADGRSMRLKRDFGYVEDSGREWPVPAETIVDGASIPKVFWSLIGGPFEGLYRNASVVHDYYCDVQTRPWQETHRVFYSAMLCGGVSTVRAKTMYYAVYRFGPRWTTGPAAIAEAFESTGGPASVPTPLPVEPFNAESFEADASRILEQNLGIADIEALADAHGVGRGKPMLESAGGATTDNPNAASLEVLADEALAAFKRQSLLQRLVALQDVASDPVEGESVGQLLSRYNFGVHEPRVEDGGVESEAPTLTVADLAAKYETLYRSCKIRPEREGEVAWHRKKLVQYRARYEAVEAKTGVPWWFVGVVHALEASFSFSGHLHNGDPLTARTVQVPRHQPEVWNPPNDWESSAFDALALKNLVGLTDWSLPQALYRWEKYNGFGYYAKGINSPYLWSFSNQYTSGKFVADHVFKPDAVSKQCGAAVMLKALELAGLVNVGSTEGSQT